MLCPLCLGVVGENLGRKIKDRKWAWNAGRSTDLNDCQVPAHHDGNESEASSDLEIVDGVRDTCSSGVVSQLPVSSSEEAEDEDEGGEDDDEWDVDSQGANEENEADECQDTVIVSLASIVCLGQSTGYISNCI